MNFKQGERFLPFLPFERGDKSQPPPQLPPSSREPIGGARPHCRGGRRVRAAR